MKHVYLTEKEIYLASANRHITKMESRELAKKLDSCNKRMLKKIA